MKYNQFEVNGSPLYYNFHYDTKICACPLQHVLNLVQVEDMEVDEGNEIDERKNTILLL